MKSLVFFISLIIFPLIATSQYSITGTVVNEKGDKLSFATVYLTNTTKAASTDDSGRFVLSDIASGPYELQATFIGYQRHIQSIDVNQDIDLTITLLGDVYGLDKIEILSNRAGDNSPFTKTNLDKADLQKENLGVDVPYLLQWTPSLVVASDAGAGIGYTNLRLRGTDQTRINVTINGVPLNDAESQNVFWVDLPDLMSVTKNVQIQRGVGVSTNGVGAFGGSISINTNDIHVNPYLEGNGSIGSFNTRKLSIGGGTGLMADRYTIDAKYSSIKSDGYIDRAKSDLTSFYFSAARVTAKSSIRLNIMSGKEVTYQSWYGTPQAKVNNDAQGLLEHYNNNIGSIYKSVEDSINLFSSDRRFNYYRYPNQIDNYRQTHVQFIHSLAISKKTNIQTTLFYTRGSGYYEEYKSQEDFDDYGLSDVSSIIGSSLRMGDIIRQRWLANDLLGINANVNHEFNKQLSVQSGVSISTFDGNHFGNVIRLIVPEGTFKVNEEYYRNKANKTDASIFARLIYEGINKLSLFADAQIRSVHYTIDGIDNDLRNLTIEFNHKYFNPKVGAQYAINKNNIMYASLAVANKEPSRSDFIDQINITDPKSERLVNTELSHIFNNKYLRWQNNVYWMNYKNQLVVTGALNDVGSALRTNVDKSYRLGVESDIAVQLSTHWLFNANVTISKNKIQNFEEIVYDYTNGYDVVAINHKNTDIAFSPSIIQSTQIVYKPIKDLQFGLSSKYVGKQYLDNTSNEARSLPAFNYQNINIGYTFSLAKVNQATATLLINNIFNTKYSSNGYTYSYIYDRVITENFLYPQAGTNLVFGLQVKL